MYLLTGTGQYGPREEAVRQFPRLKHVRIRARFVRSQRRKCPQSEALLENDEEGKKIRTYPSLFHNHVRITKCVKGTTLEGVVLREDDSACGRTHYHYPLQDESEALWEPTDEEGNKNEPGMFRIVYDPSINPDDNDKFDVITHIDNNEFEILTYHAAKEKEAQAPATFGHNDKQSETEWPALPGAKKPN